MPVKSKTWPEITTIFLRATAYLWSSRSEQKDEGAKVEALGFLRSCCSEALHAANNFSLTSPRPSKVGHISEVLSLVYWGYIGIVEKKMETIIVLGGYIGVILGFLLFGGLKGC